MITVFYDGKCGLCSKEINYYKGKAPENIFNWIDVTENYDVLKRYNISQEMALKRLHVLGHDSKMHIGVDGFILIWREMRYFKFLAYFASLPVLKPILRYLYGKFADFRFKKLDHCQITLYDK